MGIAVANQWDQIATVDWNINSALMLIATTCLIFHIFLVAYGWHLILKTFGCKTRAKTNIRIWLLSAVTRYLPGGIWSYASRAVLAKQEGVNFTTASLSMYLETILLAATSFAVGIPALFISTGIPIDPSHAIIVWLILGLSLHPKALRLLRFIPGRIGKAIDSAKFPATKTIFALYWYYIALWCFFIFTFGVFVNAIHPIEISQYMIVGSSFALAFFIGFIIIVFPSGIGIREAILYSLLASIIPSNTSLIIAISSRIWSIVGEAFSVTLVLIWKKD